MSADQEWFVQKMKELEIGNDKVEILSDIKSRLDTSAPMEITSNMLTKPQLFDCAYNNTKEETQLACDILSVCLSTLDINRTDFSKNLIKSLKHRNPKLRALALNEIHKKLLKAKESTGDSSDSINFDEDMTMIILKALEDEEIEVAAPAMKILSITLQTQLSNAKIREVFKSQLSENEVVKLRIYEVSINLVKNNSSMIKMLNDVLEKMFDELDSDDILLQMNLLELLVSLAEQNHGLLYIEDQKIFEKFSKRVENVQDDPLALFLVPGFLKFYGKIAFFHPKKIIEGYPAMVDYLFSNFVDIDQNIFPVALDTLGNLAYSKEGKILLDTHFPEQMDRTMKEYLFFLQNLSTAIKCRIFNSLQVMFSNDNSSPSTEVEEITKKWFTSFVDSDNDMEKLLEYCKNPFPDIKSHCFSLIQTICNYKWGIEAVKYTATLIELLLNRSIEFDKDVKYIKFQIISLLADSNQFDGSLLLQLKRYVAEGPYFVQPVMEVAVE